MNRQPAILSRNWLGRDFLKNEYGTGGGTWSEGNGWSDY
jgi:hypothetical protein